MYDVEEYNPNHTPLYLCQGKSITIIGQKRN